MKHQTLRAYKYTAFRTPPMYERVSPPHSSTSPRQPLPMQLFRFLDLQRPHRCSHESHQCALTDVVQPARSAGELTWSRTRCAGIGLVHARHSPTHRCRCRARGSADIGWCSGGCGGRRSAGWSTARATVAATRGGLLNLLASILADAHALWNIVGLTLGLERGLAHLGGAFLDGWDAVSDAHTYRRTKSLGLLWRSCAVHLLAHMQGRATLRIFSAPVVHWQ